jgi:hypothetical protein
MRNPKAITRGSGGAEKEKEEEKAKLSLDGGLQCRSRAPRVYLVNGKAITYVRTNDLTRPPGLHTRRRRRWWFNYGLIIDSGRRRRRRY